MGPYEQLRQLLDKHLSGAPESPAVDEILRLLFTEAEVKVALGLTFAARPASAVAAAAGVSESEARARCEAMADKGIVFARDKDGERGYALLPVIPGVFEFPFMKGGGEPIHTKLGPLWERYHAEALGNSFAASATPLMRVIPVEAAVDARTEILPFEVISGMLRKNSFFAVAQCACRVSVGQCDGPHDVCLVFDQTGKYLVERGFAREVSRSEALAIVTRAEEAGLVHTTNNSQDRLNLICNCCPCCCTILRGLTQLKNPNAFAVSKWVAQADPDLCSACGICADERCPMDAITIDDTATVDPGRCIGCGLCTTACPEDAIALMPRPAAADPPPTSAELAIRIMTEKSKLAEFLKLVKR